MIDYEQTVEVKWSTSNRIHYISRGYEFSKIKDVFKVKVKDLMPSSKVRVKAICDYCGREYECDYGAYVVSHRTLNKDACCLCAPLKCKESRFNNLIEKRYQEIINICVDKNYQLLSPIKDLGNVKNKIWLRCSEHGLFEILLENLLNGNGCYKCGRIKAKNKIKKKNDEVEKYINSYNNNILLNKYDYTNSYEKNLKIKCGVCGNIYTTSYYLYKESFHMCRNCNKQFSKGEQLISKYLDEMGLSYECEKRFENCRDNKPLPFDFYLKDYNICIEFQGKQHYFPVDYFGGEETFKIRKMHDHMKKVFCIENNITLIEIKYNEIDFIKDILYSKINCYT